MIKRYPIGLMYTDHGSCEFKVEVKIVPKDKVVGKSNKFYSIKGKCENIKVFDEIERKIAGYDYFTYKGLLSFIKYVKKKQVMGELRVLEENGLMMNDKQLGKLVTTYV